MAAARSPATVTPAYGVGDDGHLYRRGYRMHCPQCGALGRVVGYRAAAGYVQAHRCPNLGSPLMPNLGLPLMVPTG